MNQETSKILLEISKIYNQKELVDPRIHLQPILKELKNIKKAIEQGQKMILQMNEQNQTYKQDILKIQTQKPDLENTIQRHKKALALDRDITLKEMITIQQAVKGLEEKIMHNENRAEELKAAIKQNEKRGKEIKQTIAGLKTQYNDKVLIYNKKKAELDLKLAALQSQEENLREQLDQKTLDILDDTVQNVDSRPIVFLKGDICSGCCLGVSSQIARYVVQREGLQRCENCKRILLPDSINA